RGAAMCAAGHACKLAKVVFDMVVSLAMIRATHSTPGFGPLFGCFYACHLHNEIEYYLYYASRKLKQGLTMRRDIDVSLLRSFIAVVETGSVTGAAGLLHLTQAAVSQQLKRLEELFGMELFERHHKRLALKSNGERLIVHAQRMIA